MTPDEHFDRAVEPLLDDPRVSRARMFSAWGVKTGERFFGLLWRGRLVAKLPRGRVDALVAAGEGERFEPSPGRPMKEWVVIAPHAADGWAALLGEARAFVAALPAERRRARRPPAPRPRLR